jgi:hypothetical protein
LSNSIVSQAGHLVQSPSGMSRFLVLDLPVPILVFLAKVGCVVAIGGGVNAGSTMLTPLIDFFVNEVVSI